MWFNYNFSSAFLAYTVFWFPNFNYLLIVSIICQFKIKSLIKKKHSFNINRNIIELLSIINLYKFVRKIFKK